jgi:AraC family transcriptional regulator
MQTKKLTSKLRTYSDGARLRLSPRRRQEIPDTPGRDETTLSVPGFRVTETHYSGNREWGPHFHENARLVYVLEGRFAESYDCGLSVVYVPGTLRFVPAQRAHTNSFEADSRCLIVEIEPDMLRRVEQHTQALDRPGEVQGPVTTWLAQRLYEEFRLANKTSMVSLQGILLELLAEAARRCGRGPARAIPGWLQRAREHVEANFLRSLSLAEIARVAHVNRVHLARQFRNYFSTSIGEFIRQKRVEQACKLVSTTSDPLAEIAIDCGFSDQSHFSTTFRRHMGLTPARFREQAQLH